jgi:hypothetical protein
VEAIEAPIVFAVPGRKENMLNKDKSPIKYQMNIHHWGRRPISFCCHLPDPPSFSSVTPFNLLFQACYYSTSRSSSIHTTFYATGNMLITLYTVKDFVRGYLPGAPAEKNQYDYVFM